MLDWLNLIPFVAEHEWLYRLIYSAVVILLMLIVSFIIRKVSRRVITAKAGKNLRADTLTKLVASSISYVVKFLAILEVLKVGLGIDVSSVLAAAGVLGLAVGFGSQALVKDVITGFFILFENQYAVGEKVTIDGFTGEVRELGLRSTRIKGEDGKVLFIPNGKVDKVINLSRG